MGRGKSPGCPRAVDVSWGLLLPVSEPQFTSLFEKLQVLEGKVLSLEPINLFEEHLPPFSASPPPSALPFDPRAEQWILFGKLRSLSGWTPPRSTSLGTGEPQSDCVRERGCACPSRLPTGFLLLGLARESASRLLGPEQGAQGEFS